MREGDPGIQWINENEIKIDPGMLTPPETKLGEELTNSESVPVLTEVVS